MPTALDASGSRKCVAGQGGTAWLLDSGCGSNGRSLETADLGGGVSLSEVPGIGDQELECQQTQDSHSRCLAWSELWGRGVKERGVKCTCRPSPAMNAATLQGALAPAALEVKKSRVTTGVWRGRFDPEVIYGGIEG